MAELPTVRHPRNMLAKPFTDWRIVDHTDTDPTGPVGNVTVTENYVDVQYDGVEPTTAVIDTNFDATAGETYLLRYKISNSTGLDTLTRPVGASTVNATNAINVQGTTLDGEGHYCLQFDAVADGILWVHLGIGIAGRETGGTAASFRISDVMVMPVEDNNPNGLVMEYHGLYDTTGKDHDRVGYYRFGDTRIDPTSRKITETYGTNLAPTHGDVFCVMGDSITASDYSWLAQWNQSQPEFALYGETVGGYSMIGITPELIAQYRNEGGEWGGVKASKFIISRGINDMLLWPGGLEPPFNRDTLVDANGLLALARDVMLMCFEYKAPVIFFNLSPYKGNDFETHPDLGRNLSHLEGIKYNQALADGYLQDQAVINGFHPDNVVVFDQCSLLEDPPGSFQLKADYEQDPPNNDSLHYNKAGHQVVVFVLGFGGHFTNWRNMVWKEPTDDVKPEYRINFGVEV